MDVKQFQRNVIKVSNMADSTSNSIANIYGQAGFREDAVVCLSLPSDVSKPFDAFREVEYYYRP